MTDPLIPEEAPLGRLIFPVDELKAGLANEVVGILELPEFVNSVPRLRGPDAVDDEIVALDEFLNNAVRIKELALDGEVGDLVKVGVVPLAKRTLPPTALALGPGFVNPV
jgi:hypothetical protein